jgi:transposase
MDFQVVDELCEQIDLNVEHISVLKMLAHRWQYLTDELHTIDKVLRKLTKESASTLLEQFGIGPCVAATLLVTAGDNPQSLGKESAFAALCGLSPLQLRQERHPDTD